MTCWIEDAVLVAVPEGLAVVEVTEAFVDELEHADAVTARVAIASAVIARRLDR